MSNLRITYMYVCIYIHIQLCIGLILNINLRPKSIIYTTQKREGMRSYIGLFILSEAFPYILTNFLNSFKQRHDSLGVEITQFIEDKLHYLVIHAFDLWWWRRFLRVPWGSRRSNRSILKEISTEYSLKGLMLKLKVQYLVI